MAMLATAMLTKAGLSAEMEPLLMIRPPCGDWAFMRRKACWEHRKGAVRLVATACK